MPKDAWAKARAIDKSKAARREARQAGVHQVNQRKRRGPGVFSDNSVLWFGKYKGSYLKDVPIQYLEWLEFQGSNNSYGLDMARLIEFLREKHLPARRECVRIAKLKRHRNRQPALTACPRA